MKYKGNKVRILEVLVLMFCAVYTVQADRAIQQLDLQKEFSATINCNAETGRLSVSSEPVSLQGLFNEIANQCKIDVQFDNAADDMVTVSMESVELEKAVKQILKGRNYILSYAKKAPIDGHNKLLFSGVMVLPDGEEQISERFNIMSDEEHDRTLSQLTLEQTQQIDGAKERWQVHLEKMSPAARKTMEKRLSDRVIKNALRKQKHQIKKQERKQKRAQVKAQQQEKKASRRQHMSAAELEVSEQRGQQFSDQLKLQGENTAH